MWQVSLRTDAPGQAPLGTLTIPVVRLGFRPSAVAQDDSEAGRRVAEVPPMSTVNSFGTRTALAVGGRSYQVYSLPILQKAGFAGIERLPYSMKILLENLLRHEDGRFVKQADI